jgi:hypothetical protein
MEQEIFSCDLQKRVPTVDKNIVGAIALVLVIVAVTLGVYEHYKVAWTLIVLNAVFLATMMLRNRE